MTKWTKGTETGFILLWLSVKHLGMNEEAFWVFSPFLSFSSYPQGKSDAKRQIIAIWVQTQNENTCDMWAKISAMKIKSTGNLVQREEVYMVAVFQADIRVLRKTGSKWDNKNLKEHELRLTASRSRANTNKPQHTLSVSRLLPSMDRRLHVMDSSRSHRHAETQEQLLWGCNSILTASQQAKM